MNDKMNVLHPSRDPYGDTHLFLHMQRRPAWKKIYQHLVPKWVDWVLVIGGALMILLAGIYARWQGD